MSLVENWPILRRGMWLYAGVSPINVHVLLSPEIWGTGDYEDEGSIQENQPVECYFLAYESAGSPGRFNNLVPNIASFEEAVSFAEEKFPGIQWQAP